MIGWTVLILLVGGLGVASLGFGDPTDGRQIFWGIGGLLAGLGFAILIGAQIWSLM
ncbi:MAG: hypothetical protein ACOZAM_15020 [Pseudomonadota bacterium]